MVGVQNEQLVQRRLNDGIHFVILRWDAPHHVHEVANVAQVVLGVHGRQPHVVLVGLGRKGRHFGDQAVNRQLDVRDVTVGVLRLGVERRQRRDHGAQHAHGVSAERERASKKRFMFSCTNVWCVMLSVKYAS